MALGGSSGGGSGAIKAGRAFVELFTKNNMMPGLNAAAKQLKAFGNNVTAIGRKFATVGVAGTAALAGIFKTSVGRASAFGALSLKFADSAENLSAIAYAAETASASQDDLFAAFKKLPLAIESAKTGTGAVAETFERLGINIAELSKMSITDQFISIADAMLSVADNSERLEIIQKIFGKSASSLNEFLGIGSKGIREMMAEALETGSVIATDQAFQAKRIEDLFTKAWKSVKNTILSVGDALLPAEGAIQRVTDGLVSGTQWMRQIVASNQEWVMGIGLAFVGLTGVGVSLMVIGPAIAGITAAWTAFTGIVSGSMAVVGAIKAVILAPILLIPVALVAAGAAFLAFTERGRGLMSSLATSIGDAFGPTFENVKASFAAVIDSIKRGDLGGAFSIGTGAIRVEWARLTVYMTEVWNKFKNNFLDGWQKAADKFSDIWADAVLGTSHTLARMGYSFGIYTKEEEQAIRQTMRDDRAFERKQARRPDNQPGRAADLQAARDDLAQAEREQQFRLTQSMFRQVFASMKGVQPAAAMIGGGLPADLSERVDSLRMASRGTFGGSANQGFFGGSASGNVGEKIKKGVDQTNKLLDKQNDLLAGIMTMPGGGMLFVGGK